MNTTDHGGNVVALPTPGTLGAQAAPDPRSSVLAALASDPELVSLLQTYFDQDDGISASRRLWRLRSILRTIIYIWDNADAIADKRTSGGPER